MSTRGRSRRLATIMGSVLIAFGTVWATSSFAESDPPTIKEQMERRAKFLAPAPTPAGAPDDQFNRGTPRSSVHGYAKATRERNFEQAAQYLDLSNLPSEMEGYTGAELARQLRIAAGRRLNVDPDRLSNSPEGDTDDHLAEGRDRLGQIAGLTKTYDILLQRVPREDGVYIWKFAGSTVADIPQLYSEFGYGPLEKLLPPWFFDYRIWGVEVWLWVAAVVATLISLPLAFLLTAGILHLIGRFRPDLVQDMRLFIGPVRLLLWALLTRVLLLIVAGSVIMQSLAQGYTVILVALAWIGLRCLDLLSSRTAVRLDRSGLAGSVFLLRPVTRLVKLLLITGAVLLWLDNLGYQVTTLLAGLSISGVAVALASQKSLENIFGAVTLFAGQSIRVGDFLRFGTSMGTVEEIGLRATRVRTLERSVITIANAEFANMHLDNLSKRDRFWYHPQLGLRYETTPDQIRYILVEVRKMLYAHPKVLSEPLNVRFSGFGEYSLNLEVFAYIGVTDYTESLEIAEDLNLRIMEIIAAAGSDFAFPAQIQYELPGKPLDAQQAQAVAAQVKEWKTKRALYLPNFPKEKIDEVKGSLDYPPEGSPHYAQARV